MRQPVAKPLGLAGESLRLLGVQPAGQHLFNEVTTQAAFDLGRCPLLGELEREDRGTVLERTPAAVGVALQLGRDHREHGQQVAAGPHWHQVERPGRPAGDHAHLAHAGACQGGRQRDARRQPLPAVAQAPDPEAVG